MKNICIRFHDIPPAAAFVEQLNEILEQKSFAEAGPAEDTFQIDLAKDPLSLTRADWDTILDGAKQITFPKGATIILEGESYQRMYQIVKGSVRIEVRGGPCTLLTLSACFRLISLQMKKIIDGRSLYITSMTASATFGEMRYETVLWNGRLRDAKGRGSRQQMELTVQSAS